jgi:hypothetical protein
MRENVIDSNVNLQGSMGAAGALGVAKESM